MRKAIPKQLLAKLIRRSCQSIRVFYYSLISSNLSQGKPSRNQPVLTIGLGKIIFGQNVKIGLLSSPLFFSTYAYIEARNPSALVSIDEGTWINNNFCAIAEHASIIIGRNCLLGVNVEIMDSNFHGMKVDERHISCQEWAGTVYIGDSVFIGSNVKIMKGVNIGYGSVIANGSVVVNDIPSMVIAGGNPARIIKVIE